MFRGMVSPTLESWLLTIRKHLAERLRTLLERLKLICSGRIEPLVEDDPLRRLLRHERRAFFYRP